MRLTIVHRDIGMVQVMAEGCDADHDEWNPLCKCTWDTLSEEEILELEELDEDDD